MNRGTPLFLAAMSALFVVRLLFPSESAVRGDGLPVVMLWIVLAALWLLGSVGRERFRLRFGWIDAAVVLMVAWHALAAVWAVGRGSPRPAVNMLWEWVGMGLMFLVARQLIVRRHEARAVAALMIAMAAGLSGYGLYQYFVELPATEAQYRADPEGTLGRAGIAFAPGSPQQELFENRLKDSEPMATFALTNSLAGYLAPWLVVLVGIGAGCAAGRKRLPILCCAVPIVACLLLTRSRSACVAAAVGLLTVWLLRREPARRPGWKLPAAVAGALAVVAVVAIAVGGFDRTVGSLGAKSLGYRLQYWQSTVQLIAEHPWVGCGPGNFQNAYTAYKLPEASEEIADPHNFLFEVWGTAGTPAMLALAAALVGFVWVSLRGEGDSPIFPAGKMGQSPEDEPQTSIKSVMAGGLCGFLLAVPLGLLSEAPPGFAALALALPLAAGCVALLSDWIRHGSINSGTVPIFPQGKWDCPPRIESCLPAVGVVVLLINLSAAGGIGYPSVAGSLWLLLALGLMDRPVRSLPRGAAVAGLVLMIVLAAGCYFTAYGPVLRCRGQMRLAADELARRNPARAEEHLAAAAAADRLAPEPRQQMALMALARWCREPESGQMQDFQDGVSKALELTPNSAPAWLAAGDYYLAAFQRANRPGLLDRAVGAYRRAVQLYPNSGLYRAKLALAYAEAGRKDDYRREADQALQLHHQTPHSDKKLPEELRKRLERK